MADHRQKSFAWILARERAEFEASSYELKQFWLR
jgi:hypothetical protein